MEFLWRAADPAFPSKARRDACAQCLDEPRRSRSRCREYLLRRCFKIILLIPYPCGALSATAGGFGVGQGGCIDLEALHATQAPLDDSRVISCDHRSGGRTCLGATLAQHPECQRLHLDPATGSDADVYRGLSRRPDRAIRRAIEFAVAAAAAIDSIVTASVVLEAGGAAAEAGAALRR
jgi:hypothetical protein